MELYISGPDTAAKTVALTSDSISLGRSADNHLAYPQDSRLSRHHLAFERTEEGWFVKDCASRNGTVVNTTPLTSTHKLSAGDRIYAGHLTIEFRAQKGDSNVVSFVPKEFDLRARTEMLFTNLDRVLSEAGQDVAENASVPTLGTSRVVEALIRAGQELGGHRPLAELFAILLQLALSATGAARGVVLTLENGKLVVRASEGKGFAISTSVRDRVLSEKCSLVISDAQTHQGFSDQHSIFAQGVRSMMAVPLQTATRVTGLIYLDNGSVLRPFGKEDLDLLTVLANVAAIRIEQARLAEIEQREKLTELELSQASEIQRNLLPSHVPVFDGYDLAGFNLPCRTVGGDYYDFLPYKDGRVGLLIGDVSGKGMPAALMMSSLQARVQMLKELQPDPATAVTILNRNLSERFPLGKFITFFFGLLEVKSGRFTYTNAGHNFPLILRGDGRVDQLEGSDMVLGILPNAEYLQREACLERGDTLVLFSDGVTEAFNPADEEWGETGLTTFLKEPRQATSQETIRQLTEHVRAWSNTAAFCDDFTVVVVKRS